jgi:hypothetical protein
MTKQRLWLALLVLIATLTQCSSCKENINPNELPPETQTGAGTFACRINGEVWRYNDPTGLNLKPRTDWSFIPNEKGGLLSISAVRYDNNNIAIDQLNLVADSLGIRKMALLDKEFHNMDICSSNPWILKCSDFCTNSIIDSTKNFYRTGKLVVTKLDLQTKIISGKFECTFFKIGCDTQKITEGRFDFKF